MTVPVGERRVNGLQLLSVAAVVVTFALIVLGGIVRVTNSGLGCPDWPTCHGRLVPPLEFHVLVEYSHRLLASVVSALILLLAAVAWLRHRRDGALLAAATAAVVLLLVQVVLGGITVLGELPAAVVATHLVTSLALLATLTTAAMLAFTERGGGGDDERSAHADARGLGSLRGPLTATAAVALLTMWLGAYMTISGAGLACEGWPLCNGGALPDASYLVRLQWVHRVAAAGLGLLVLNLIFLAGRRLGAHHPASRLAVLAGVLYLAQALLGALNIWTALTPAAAAAHLTVASLFWLTIVALTVVAYLARRPGRVGLVARPEVVG